MIIAIDATMLVYAGSGVARYTYDLCVALLLNQPEHTYKILYSSLRRPPETQRMLKHLKSLGALVYDLPFPPWLFKVFWNTYDVFKPNLLIGKHDVFHSSDFLRPPLDDKVIGVTTIHDITWLKYPEYHETNTIKAHENKLKKTIVGNDIILADSKNTASDLINSFPNIEKLRIHVLPLGISSTFFPQEKNTIERVRLKYKLNPNQPYLLYVGAIEPRKRLDLAVQMFAKLIQTSDGSNLQFVIAGRAGWKNDLVFQLVDHLGLSERVTFIGYVEEEDLAAMYSGASLTVYLSQYEGFGLPPIESLACGTPAIVSKNSSLVEFVHDSFLVDSDDPSTIARQAAKIMGAKSNKPLIELTKFSWSRYVAEYFRIIIEQHYSSRTS